MILSNKREDFLRVSSCIEGCFFHGESVDIDESVNNMFIINVFIRCNIDIIPIDIIGKPLYVEFYISEKEDISRSFSGIITDIWVEPRISREVRRYKLTLRPQLWLLSQNKDHRIWLNQSAVDVIETLLREHKLPACDTTGIIGSIPKIDYSVQYGETDLSYALRRMEEVGLFWWFVQGERQHRLHIANHPFAWLQPNKGESNESRVRISNLGANANDIKTWHQHFNYVPNACSAADWNFEKPKNVVQAVTPTLISLNRNRKSELFEYPARVSTIEEAELSGKLRMQATEADYERIEASSYVRTLEAGRRFQPFDAACPDERYEEYVITRIHHRFVSGNYESGSHEAWYENSFNAIPSRIPLTPHRNTHIPKIEGTSIAIIAGPPDEEIHTDRYGRVKLYFPWDRRAKKDGSDTIWVRVNQSWGGSRWGTQIIPRVGMEAIVSFIDGNPDRPVVIGIVNNPSNMPSYTLPINKTLMAIRSNTHRGLGGNEIAFEDKEGNQNQFFHAQKDRTERVCDTLTRRIDQHSINSIGGNKVEEVKEDARKEVGGNSITIVGEVGAAIMNLITQQLDLSLKTGELLKESAKKSGIKQDEIINFSDAVSSQIIAVIESSFEVARLAIVNGPNPQADAGKALAAAGKLLAASRSLKTPIKGLATTLIASFKSESVGVSSAQQVGVSKVTNVGKTCLENVGKYKSITVGDEFKIECGQSSIVMRKDGEISFNGVKFNFNTSGPMELTGASVIINKKNIF